MRQRIVNKRVLVVFVVVATTLAIALPALGGGRPLTADLSAGNEVPPAPSSASGTAWVTLNQGLGEVCVEIESSGYTGTVVAGHIHSAVAGVNGGVIVDLGVNSANYSACIGGVDADLIKDIRQHPENFYINIHSTVVPSGESRGQLSK